MTTVNLTIKLHHDMHRIPYEIVAIEADRLIVRMVLSYELGLSQYYWELYLGYIAACGWTDQEFDQETLRRVDVAWDNVKRQLWN